MVNKADTTITITNAASLTSIPTVVNQPYAVNWTVAANAPSTSPPPTLTGNMTVSDGTGGTCTAAIAAGTCSVTSTSPGSKTITVSYSGDTNFNAAPNATTTHTVNQANTTTTITSFVGLTWHEVLMPVL